MSYRSNDLCYGFNQEENQQLIEEINKKFNTNIKKMSRYHIYDFLDEEQNIYIELKSRRIPYNKYKTTLLCDTKFKNIEETIKKYRIIFLFNFIDGLYYIEYKKDKFNEYKETTKRLIRGDYCKNKEIPINDLIKL